MFVKADGKNRTSQMQRMKVKKKRRKYEERFRFAVAANTTKEPNNVTFKAIPFYFYFCWLPSNAINIKSVWNRRSHYLVGNWIDFGPEMKVSAT